MRLILFFVLAFSSLQAFSDNWKHIYCDNGHPDGSGWCLCNEGTTATYVSGSTDHVRCVPDGETASKSPSGNSVCAQLAQKAKKCTADTQAAVGSCKADNNAGMNDFAHKLNNGLQVANQVMTMGGASLSGKQACSMMVPMINEGTQLMDAFDTACTEKRQACDKSCNDYLDSMDENDCLGEARSNAATYSYLKGEKSDMDANLQTCGKQKTVATAGRQYSGQSLISTIQQSQACRAAMEANASLQNCFSYPMPQTPECIALNSTGVCDPAKPTNLTCACKDGVGTPTCQSFMASQNMNSGTTSHLNANLPLDTHLSNDKSGSPGFDLTGLDGLPVGGAKSTGGSEDIGGKMGGAAGIDRGNGGGAAPGAKHPPGADPNAINTNINGSAGRGGGGGGSNYGGGGGGGSYAVQGGAADRVPGSPNLNEFRPNMAAPQGRRTLAGVTGPDGLLGPHADFWVTIKNRYNYEWQQGNFKP